MAIIPFVEPLKVAQAAEQNALITQVNTNTNAIESNTSNLDAAGSSVSDLQGRVSTLEEQPSGGTSAGTYFGSWIDNRGEGQVITTGSGTKLTPWTVPQGTVTGCSMNNGTLTVQESGLWYIVVSVQYGSGTSVRAVWLATSANASGAGTTKIGSIAGPSMDVITTSNVFRLPAQGVVSAYSAIWQGGDPVSIFKNVSNSFTAVWLGP